MAKKQNRERIKETKGMDVLADILAKMNQEEGAHVPSEKELAAQQRDAHNEFRNPSYGLVSIMAYLLGIDKRHFDNQNEPPQLAVYEQLSQKKENRIIRNLCMLRTAMEQNYMAIVRAFRYELKNIDTMPKLIPSDAAKELMADGIRIYRTKPEIDAYLIAINSEINNRINTISGLFPEWIKWDYIKPIFLMPSGTKSEGLKAAGQIYNSDRNRYPYNCWINWDAIAVSDAHKGNILYNDEKFVTLLYERHEDRFDNLSLVRDAGNITMRNLTDLLTNCKKCVIVVDCENSDAIKLAAALSSLKREQLDKISKVILFDSEYTTPQWITMVDRSLRIADQNATQSLAIEHMVVTRLNQNKSQVDMTLAVRTSKEVYTNDIDAVILVSSDSDYWAMIQQLEHVRFLVMLEHSKTGLAIMDTLAVHDIPFCFIDDFCTSASYSIKTATLVNAIQNDIDRSLRGDLDVPLNIRSIMDAALRNSWIDMTGREKESFYQRCLQHMKLSVGHDGLVSIRIEV